VAALLVIRPDPLGFEWSQVLLMLSPLVLVPLGLRLMFDDAVTCWPALVFRTARAAQLPAALLLGSAFLVPRGIMAAVMALPWATTTGLIALYGVMRVRRRGFRPLADLCIDAGLVYVVVGSIWAIFDRLGLRPLGFAGVIVLLTAIHFHYAGFVLPLMTGFPMRAVGGSVAAVAGVGVITGVPLVAVGITATQIGLGPFLECLAAWLTALGGVLTAWLHSRLAAQRHRRPLARGLWAVSAGSLAASMILAALYGSRSYAPAMALDVPWMQALHGSANALGFGLAGFLAWALDGAHPARRAN